MFDLENPLGANQLLASRSRDEFPGAIGALSIKLFECSLLPLFWWALRFSSNFYPQECPCWDSPWFDSLCAPSAPQSLLCNSVLCIASSLSLPWLSLCCNSTETQIFNLYLAVAASIECLLSLQFIYPVPTSHSLIFSTHYTHYHVWERPNCLWVSPTCPWHCWPCQFSLFWPFSPSVYSNHTWRWQSMHSYHCVSI